MDNPKESIEQRFSKQISEEQFNQFSAQCDVKILFGDKPFMEEKVDCVLVVAIQRNEAGQSTVNVKVAGVAPVESMINGMVNQSLAVMKTFPTEWKLKFYKTLNERMRSVIEEALIQDIGGMFHG